MERRNCCEVIKQMLEKIPESKIDLIKDLKENYNDAIYKAPEENIQWIRTMHTLDKHFLYPKDEWEFEVLSIFTTKSISELKILVQSELN